MASSSDGGVALSRSLLDIEAELEYVCIRNASVDFSQSAVAELGIERPVGFLRVSRVTLRPRIYIT